MTLVLIDDDDSCSSFIVCGSLDDKIALNIFSILSVGSSGDGNRWVFMNSEINRNVISYIVDRENSREKI